MIEYNAKSMGYLMKVKLLIHQSEPMASSGEFSPNFPVGAHNVQSRGLCVDIASSSATFDYSFRKFCCLNDGKQSSYFENDFFLVEFRTGYIHKDVFHLGLSL